MKIVTDREANRVLAIGTLKGFWDNGYPIIADNNSNEVAYPVDFCKLYDVEVPQEVVPEKYCYTPEDGFYKNPDYVEINNSYGLPNEVYDAIRDEAVAQIESEVAGNAD